MRAKQERIHGRLRLQVRSAEGGLEAERHAANTVLRQGAEIVARRFAGAADSPPINRVQVGFGRETMDVESTGLTGPPSGVDPQALITELTPDQFQIATDEVGFVRVSVAAEFQPTVELEGVSEAGLLAGDRLYNQVVFEPVTLRPGQNVTFFWEIDFPFGS